MIIYRPINPNRVTLLYMRTRPSLGEQNKTSRTIFMSDKNHVK